MDTQIENSGRIAKNTLMLYMRMLIGMAVSLYTTRIVLGALGTDDYGIYTLVGSVVGVMSMVTSLLSQGTSRFITMALGRNNEEQLCNTFSAATTIHVVLALLILLVGEIVGPGVIEELNIASDRMDAAQYVFQLSLVSSVVAVMQVPFHAVIVAHEKMSVYAYISIFEVVAKLLLVCLLLVMDTDKLKLYATFYLAVGVVTAFLYYFYGRKHFVECRNFKFRPDWKLYREMADYTGWNAIGACAFTMNGQGVTILLSHFGTVVNAARGLAGYISGVVYGFVNNFQTAARPQIVKLCAAQDYERMNKLIIKVSKFSSYLVGLIGVPLFLEMDYVLGLWLYEVPDYTVVFARLTLLQGFVQAMDAPVGTGIHAVGRMKLPNLTSAFIYMMVLPVSYVAVKLGSSPEIAYVITVCAYPLALCMDLYILRKYSGFPCAKFFKEAVGLPCLFVALSASIAELAVGARMEASLGRAILTTALSLLLLLWGIYWKGLTKGERNYIKEFITDKLKIRHE